MNDRVLALHMSVEACVVAEVVLHELDVGGVVLLQPREVAVRAGPAEVVEQSDLPALAGQVCRGVDPQEAGASGDENSTRHEGPYLSQSRTLSGRRWPRSRPRRRDRRPRVAWCRPGRSDT